MKYPKDIAGMKFGRLTAIKKVGTKGNGKGSKSIWLCRCDCGNEKEILRNSLVSGTTKSCGCLEKEVKATKIWNGKIKDLEHLDWNERQVFQTEQQELSEIWWKRNMCLPRMG